VYSDNSFNLYPKHYIGHYKTALNMIKDKPYLGIGPDTFKDLCSNNKYEFIYDTFYNEKNELVNIDSCSTHPHNYYLQNFAESGILTFVLLCLFYFFILKEFINFFISDNPLAKNPLYKISIIAILCNFFPFAPNTDFYNTHLNTLIYLPIIFFIYFKYIKKYT
jgi:O-antigen ligase